MAVTVLDCDCYVPRFSSFPFLADAVVGAQVTCNNRGEMKSIMLKEGNKRYYIVEGSTWNPHTTPDIGFLKRLRSMFDYANHGTYATPGAFGQSIWRRIWHMSEHRRVSRPPVATRNDLLDHLVGGRVDQLATTEATYPVLYELDMRNAYLQMLERVPGGTASRALRPLLDDDVATWYAECECILVESLPIAAFCMQSERPGTNLMPTAPGQYTVWLWKEEALAARDAGVLVYPRRGWSWEQFDYGNHTYCQHMRRLREEAPDDFTADCIKHAIVAATGRHGIGPYIMDVIDESEATDEDRPLALFDASRPHTRFFCRMVPDENAPNLTHWYSHVLASCRVALYSQARREMETGNTIAASNYDSLYLTRPSIAIPDHTLWKASVLHHARLPYARAIVSDQKTRLPGMRRDAII